MKTPEPTDDQLRNALEKWAGYIPDGNLGMWRHPSYAKWILVSDLPNYPGDLNAVAELEGRLSDEQHYDYRAALWDITAPPSEKFDHAHHRNFCSATARQRCLAIFRALGLEVV